MNPDFLVHRVYDTFDSLEEFARKATEPLYIGSHKFVNRQA
jgi:hypothetical protein